MGMKVVVDRVNKNAFMNKFSVESTIHKDDRMALEMSVNTMVTPYTFHMNAPYFLPRFFNHINRKTIDATIMHEMGSKLEVKSNCPEFETFIITTTGNYAIDRHANWEMNKPRYMFNWVGKSEFKSGPFSSFSPIDTKMNFVFNTRKMVLNADMVETMGGKQWG